MSDVVIRAEGLGKQYRRGLHLEPYKTARDAIASLFRNPLARRRAAAEDPWFWALRDLSFEVREGESVGIVGRNGAGKTTLLKILSRVTTPTTGRVEITGRVGSLLEVGTGFHLELTGRENVKLNGAILGLKRREIQSRFDDIVEFAGIEEFIDTPVKRYSSGMFMRLAFSVAAHLDPDILVVDEVLAVGDAQFQKKCLGKLDEVGQQGRTVLFVSHNMAAVSQICSRALLLERGALVEDGRAGAVVEAYIRRFASAEAEVTFEPDADQSAAFVRLTTVRADGTPSSWFGVDQAIICEAEFEARETLRDEHVWLRVYQASGLLLILAADDDVGVVPEVRAAGRYVVRFTIPPFLLNEGKYSFRIQLLHRTSIRQWTILDDRRSTLFDVEDTIDYGDSVMGKRKGVLRVPLAHEERRLGELAVSSSAPVPKETIR
jgi:lipopolysaccharide transport system ATP-binding protein